MIDIWQLESSGLLCGRNLMSHETREWTLACVDDLLSVLELLQHVPTSHAMYCSYDLQPIKVV